MIIAILVFVCLMSFVIYQQYIEGTAKDLKKGNSPKYLVFWIITLGIIILTFPIILTKFSVISLDYNNPGEIGDIIGGTTAPFFAFIGIIVTFYAFWVQYQANIKQRHDIQLERFENKFYQLVGLHKSNVDEMVIAGKVHKRKCFVSMFEELRLSHAICNELYKNTSAADRSKHNYHEINLTDFSYKVFFFGVGHNSEKQLLYFVSKPGELHLFRRIRTILAKLQGDYEQLYKANNFSDKSLVELQLNVGTQTFDCHLSYLPFDGHVHRLGHYFRHLFQTVRYVVEQDDDFLNFRQKYWYLKTLRAQLSNHEQLLLYYNALCQFGEEWLKNEYFTKYRFIKNLPIPLADFGILPEVKFANEIQTFRDHNEYLFEWHQHKYPTI